MPTVTGPIPLTVNFTDTSVGAVDWLWNFDVTPVGNEGTSTQRNPTHIYNQVGTFGVSLTVSNISGTNTITEEVAVIATSPDLDEIFYTLNMVVNNPGPIPGGTVHQGGTSPYVEGEVVIIVAEPDYTYEFIEWTGIGQISNRNNAETEITMNGNYTITAQFSSGA